MALTARVGFHLVARRAAARRSLGRRAAAIIAGLRAAAAR